MEAGVYGDEFLAVVAGDSEEARVAGANVMLHADLQDVGVGGVVEFRLEELFGGGEDGVKSPAKAGKAGQIWPISNDVRLLIRGMSIFYLTGDEFSPWGNVCALWGGVLPLRDSGFPRGEKCFPLGSRTAPGREKCAPGGTGVVPLGRDVFPKGRRLFPAGRCVRQQGDFAEKTAKVTASQ